MCDELIQILWMTIIFGFITLGAIFVLEKNVKHTDLGIMAKRWRVNIAEFLTIFLLFGSIILIFVIKKIDIYFIYVIIFAGLQTLYVFFIFEYALFYKEKFNLSLNKKLFHFIFFIIILFAWLLNTIYIDVSLTFKGKYLGTKIFTKDSIYISDKSSFFIGKTEKFYFIRNRRSSTLVIPEKEVIKFDLKINRIKASMLYSKQLF